MFFLFLIHFVLRRCKKSSRSLKVMDPVAIVVLVFHLTGLNCKVGKSGKKLIKFPLKLNLKWYFVTKLVLTYRGKKIQWLRKCFEISSTIFETEWFFNLFLEIKTIIIQMEKNIWDLETYRKEYRKETPCVARWDFSFGVQVPRDIG